MDNQGNGQSAKKLDPLQVLPPELALQCLQESLPSGSYLYSSAVFELASVSTRWEDFILSAPAIWQEIHLKYDLQDLFAIVSTFAYFSRTASLDVTIWGDVCPELPVICSILLPHKHRIHRLIFRSCAQPEQSREQLGSWRMPTVVQVIESLGYLSSVQEIDFGPDLQWDHSQIKPLLLPPTTRITNAFDYRSLMKDMEQIELHRITTIETFSNLDNLVPSIEAFTNLAVLRLYGTSDIPPRGTPALKRASLHLTSISYYQDYCPNLGKLLRLVSSQLTHLNMKIPVAKLEELVENLKSMGSLNALVLVVTNWEEPVPLISTVCSTTITTLHTLEFRTQGYGELNNSQPILWLFEAFITLYSMVKRIELLDPSNILSFANRYLESLRSLEWIRVGPLAPPRKRVFLSSLQSMHCVPRALSSFYVPNLLHFTISYFTKTSELDDLRMSNLRKLTMRTDRIDEVDLNFEGNQFPKLHEISIYMSSPKQRWNLTSFPQLSSIVLFEASPLGPHCTRLCTSLIYNPEICPSLRHIRLYAFVEWDILFLMLQRRNCETTGVSKISSVDQEFVPLTLQPILSALLEGISVDVLGNEELGMEATREAICDPNVVGCIRCLKRMWPGCMATVDDLNHLSYDVSDELSLTLEPPPPTIPSAIREWLVQYAKTAEKWKDSFTKFQSKHYRQADCARV